MFSTQDVFLTISVVSLRSWIIGNQISAVSKEEFVAKITDELEYQPSLGGPYLAASASSIEENSLTEKLFDILAGEKEKLTKNRMSVRMKEIAGGEEALTWPAFLAALSEA